jgi:vacuolar-type H+-ATPase subunit H
MLLEALSGSKTAASLRLEMVVLMAHSESKSIEDIQDAEGSARKAVEDAERSKAERIAKAREKAAAIVAEAAERSKRIRAEIIGRAGEEMARSREKGLGDARSLAKRIQGMKVSKGKIRSAIEKAATELVG